MPRSHSLPLVAVLAVLVAAPAFAMKAPAYKTLRSQLRKTSFSSGRLGVVRVAASGNTFTSQQVKGLLQVFSFSSSKIKALRVLSPRITDPQNSFIILNTLTFSSDKKKATVILKTAGSGVPKPPPPVIHAPPPAYRAPPPHAPVQPRAHRGPAPAQPRHHGHPHAAEPHSHHAHPHPRHVQPQPRHVQPQPRHVQPQPRHVQRPRPRSTPVSAPAVGYVSPYPVSAGWAAQGYGHVINVWPERALKRLRRSLQAARSTREKLTILKRAVASRHEGISADQLLTVLRAFGVSKAMVRVLEILEPKILAMPAQDVASILQRYPFSDRIRVLHALKNTILDLENKHVILGGLTRASNRIEAAKLLASVHPRSPLYGSIRGRHVVFVIDCSSPMSAVVFTNGRRRVSRLDYARYELGRALKSLPTKATFNIVVFAGGVLRWQPRGVFATPRNVSRAMAFMDHQRADGTTNIWDAMKLALTEPAVDEVHLLTAGKPTAGPVRGYGKLLSRFRSLLPRRPVRIYGSSLLMGNFQGDRKGKSAQMVCILAHETGGLCRVLR